MRMDLHDHQGPGAWADYGPRAYPDHYRRLAAERSRADMGAGPVARALLAGLDAVEAAMDDRESRQTPAGSTIGGAP